MGSALSVLATLGLPLLMAYVLSQSQAPGCSAEELSKAGPGLHALPRSKPLRFRFSGTPQRHRLGWASVLCPSQVRGAQATRCLVSVFSTGRRCILSPPLSQLLGFLCAQWEYHLRCAMCLLWGADLWLWPSWWMSTIQDPRKTWLATGGLLTVWWRMPALGLRLPLALQLWLSSTCLSASGGGWADHSCIALLWCWLSLLF